MTTPDSVIRAYLAMTGLYALAASLIWGVNTLFLLDAGLSVFGVFVANAVFTAAMALFEVPTGVVADTRGRRASFLLSIVVLLIGTLGYVFTAFAGHGLIGFCFWSVVLGLGYTFYSGAMEAWLVDALNATAFDGSTDKVFARASLVFSGAMLVGTIGGGVLGTFDLSLPYLVRGGLLAMLYAVAWVGMVDLGFTPSPVTWSELPGEMSRIARESARYGWRVPSVRLLMLSSSVIAVSSAWGFHSWQPYFLDLLHTNQTWVAGVIAAAASFATMGGNALVEYFTRYCGKRTTLMLWGYGIQAVAFALVGVVGSFWLALPLYLVAQAASGVVGPVYRAYLHKKVPSAHRATVVSLDSMLSSGASMGGQASLGYMAQRVGFGPGYAVGGIIDLLALPLVLGIRAGNEEQDRIVGSAGVQGACPVGLPEGATVVE